MSLCLSLFWAFQSLHIAILSYCCTELTVTSRSEDSKSGRRASLIYWLLIYCPPEGKVHKATCLCWFPLLDELLSPLYYLSVFVEHKGMGSAIDSACVQLGVVRITLSLHWSSLDPDFFVYAPLCPALRGAKHALSFVLKKSFSAFHLNQACITLCSPFLTQTVDVQLQICRIQRHLLYFSRSGYCSWDERVRGLAAPPSVGIDNAWVRLFLCPVFCGYLTWRSNVLPAAPLALIRVKYVPSPNDRCSCTFRHMSALDESEELQLQESLVMLTRSSPCQTSFYWGSPRMCWWERKDFE